MARLIVYDPVSHLFMTGLRLPGQVTFASTPTDARSNGPEVGGWTRLPDDVGFARTLTVIARQAAAVYLRGIGPAIDPAGLGLATWVVRPSANGRLADWFTGQSPSTYRVMIHRTPTFVEHHGEPVFWDTAYHHILRGRRREAAREPVIDAFRCGREVLEEGLVVFRAGPGAVRAWADGLGHPYVHVA